MAATFGENVIFSLISKLSLVWKDSQENREQKPDYRVAEDCLRTGWGPLLLVHKSEMDRRGWGHPRQGG